ncbi:MAG: ribulose-phosphate 3-epimerase [Flavobacteriales bacterium]|nr:ribulose-phosphate 3-epimerase [Flavobacteriales bacterium]
MSHKIAPSILAADFGNLKRDCEIINQSEADWYHLDIMDGVFVPNISYGMPVIKKINELTNKILDVHLMIIDPDRYVKTFKECGADILTVHIETCNHLHRTIQNIKNNQMKAGVAINPHTPINSIYEIAKELDLVLIMSVNPGFGGQSFIENTYRKIEELVLIRKETNSNFLIEIDGGVNLNNAKKLIQNGADVLVAGSFIFNSKDPKKTIKDLKSIIHD